MTQPGATQQMDAPKPANEIAVPRVTLQMFTQVCGVRREQLAGFIRNMQNQAPPKRTIAEWHTAYKTFMDRPVKG